MFNSYKDIDISWLKKNNLSIHYFGWFIQIKINDIYRLHFYTHLLPPIMPKESAHTHRYNFTSKILKGSFKQDIYQVLKNKDGDYWLGYESCGRGELPEYEKNYKESVSCKLILSNTYTTESEYNIDKDTFHTVSANECITLLKRENDRLPYAKIISLKEENKICPFSKKVEEIELWNIVEQMLL